MVYCSVLSVLNNCTQLWWVQCTNSSCCTMVSCLLYNIHLAVLCCNTVHYKITVLYCSVLNHCTVLYCTESLYCTLLYWIPVLYCTVLNHRSVRITVLYFTVLNHRSVLYCTESPFCTVRYCECTESLYCTVVYWITVLYCSVLIIGVYWSVVRVYWITEVVSSLCCGGCALCNVFSRSEGRTDTENCTAHTEASS